MHRPPIGLHWRSTYTFTTFVVGLGVATDLLIYSIVIPVLPFRLETLGYDKVSSKTGWLLFFYSGSLALGTIPTAMLSERYDTRKTPLIIALIVLLGSQALLMEAPFYWLMCLARVLQGLASAVMWVVGLALLADAIPPSLVGQQFGLAMTGVSTGVLIGPACGGALYDRFGFRGPFVFAMVVTLLDLTGRLLIIERKEASKWGYDPAVLSANPPQALPMRGYDREQSPSTSPPTAIAQSSEPVPSSNKRATLLFVVRALFTSSRAISVCAMTLVYGLVLTTTEPALPVYLHERWGLDSTKVGLVFLAGVVPTLMSPTVAGWLIDRYGSAYVSVITLALSLPWWGLLIIKSHLAVFIVFYAFQNLFATAMMAPITYELTSISAMMDGVGYAHVFGAFNLFYAAGSTAGPLIGGQIYDRTTHGWTIICIFSVGLLAVSLVLLATYTGETPLLSVFKQHRIGVNARDSEATICAFDSPLRSFRSGM